MKSVIKNKKLSIILLTAIMVFCTIFAGVAIKQANMVKADMVISGANVSQSYGVGYTFKFGQVSATVNDVETTASIAIKKDGETIAKSSEQDSYTFEEAGDYQIVYYATVNGKYYNKVVDITVSVKPYFDFSNVQTNYNLGDQIELVIDAVSGDSRVPAEVSLSGPDGAIPVGKTHTFDMLGDYVLSAKATIGGQEYFDTFTVNVSSESYLDLFYVKEGNVEFEENVDAPDYRYAGNGITFKPVSGSVIRYANVVNLYNVDKQTSLMTFTTFLGGEYTNISNIALVLTDVYNAKNRIEIQIFSLTDSSNVFAKIVYGSISTGLSGSKPSTTKYTTELVDANFQNKFHDGTYSGKKKCYVTCTFDPIEKAFYASTTGKNAKMILDLDNPLHVGYGKEWAGWTTGEVYAEIRTTCTENSRVLLTEFCGQSLSGSQIVDNMAPSIITETMETYLPLGFVGKQYKIPAVVSAVDLIEGKIPFSNVRTQVVRLNNGLAIDYTNQVENGSFVPDVAGEYRIEYYAQDSVGIKSIKLCYFTVEAADVTPIVFCPIPETAIVGSTLQIPEITVTGLSEIVRTSIKYVYNNDELDKKPGDIVYFNQGGTFKVVYEFEDYVGNVESGEKIVQLQISDKPIIKLSGVPYTAVKGNKLLLPDFEAIDFNFAEGQTGRYPSRTITVNGTVLDSTRLYQVTQNAGEILEVNFSAGGVTETRYVEVIDPTYRSDYFLTTAEKEDTEDGVKFTFNQDTTVKLANPFYVNDDTGMKIRWDISKTSNFKYFTYQLTDFYDYSKQIKVVIDVELNKIQTNDSGEWSTFSADTGYGLTYNNYSYQIVGIGIISNYLDGMPFAGFGDMVIVEFGFSGVKAQSQVTVTTLGRATLAGEFVEGVLQPYVDTKALPVVLRSAPTYENGTLTISTATAWKLFSGQIPVTVTLKNPSGKPVSSLAKLSADKEYKVSISEYGWWTVSYQYAKASEGGAAGGNGTAINEEKYNLIDTTPITYKMGSIATSVSVNGSIKLPTVNILTGGTVTCKYVVIEANGHVGIYQPGNSVKLTSAGVCRIILIMSNETQEKTAHFEVNVKEGK